VLNEDYTYRPLLVPQRLPALVLLVTLAYSYSYATEPAKSQPSLSPDTQSQLNPSQLARDDVTAGFAYLQHSQDANAKNRFDAAILLAQAEHDLAVEASARRGLGLILIHAAQYETARAQFEQSLTQAQAAGDAKDVASDHQELGTVAYYMSDLKSMRSFWNLAWKEFEALGDRPHEEDIIYNLGFDPTLSDQKRERLIREGLVLARQDHDKDREGNFLHHLADLRYTQGNYTAALELLSEAQLCFQQAGDQLEVGRALNSRARLYKAHGLYALAISTDTQALKIQRGIGDQTGILQSLTAIGDSYGLMGDEKHSLVEYEQALAIAQQAQSPRLIAFVRGDVAGEQIKLGQYHQAARTLTALVKDNTDPFDLTLRYAQLSEADVDMGDFRDALNADNAANAALLKIPNSATYEQRVIGMYLRAKAEAGLGQVNHALSDIHACITMLEHIRSELVPNDSMKLQFGDLYKGVYDYGIELNYQNGDMKQALEIAEEGQARAFVDLLSSRHIALRPAERVASSNIQKQAGPGKPDDLSSRGDTSSGNNALEKAAGVEPLPSFVSIKAMPIEQIAAIAMQMHTTLINYWVTKDRTYIWVINPAGNLSTLRVTVTRQHLSDLIAQVWAGAGHTQNPSTHGIGRRQLAGINTAAVNLTIRGGGLIAGDRHQNQAWHELFRLLILPIRDRLPQKNGSLLTIIPNGPLFGLSFAALQDDAGHYLVEKYAFDYVPSVAVLRYTEIEAHQMGDRPTHYLLVADPKVLPDLPDGKSLPALPGSLEEVKAIRKLLPANEATVLIGSQAREDIVEQRAPESSVIHFATHAVILPDDPLDSFIALGRNSANAAEDGRLTAGKIYKLKLNTKLVFLSTCRSASGQITEDGIVGLTRAFFYAGTPTVVASLWDVADKPTSILVSDFYAAYRDQYTPSEALRQAQLKMLRSLRAGKILVNTPAGTERLPENPLFWSSFIVIGNP
jgi:CHAT domain-containing protein/tetratricopeptide (TPR) repeat protein